MKKPAVEGEVPPPASSAPLRLDAIILCAAGLDGDKRDSYLDSIAATDPDLATAARRRLVAAEEISDSFLDTPAAARLDGSGESPDVSPTAAALPAVERYELGECLGQGGMGRVVKAFDRQLDRTVALKFLTHEDPAILRLFLREARTQARVQHPHVLEVYDSGDLGGEPFIAMRYVAGGTLAEVGPTLSLDHRVRLLVQAAEGLHSAHRQGLLHRDVKPSNILVEQNSDGELVSLVTDFGLATELENGGAMAADAVAGSPQYIAPERLQGSSAAVDRRSDVYSLGVTLYRLLTGELPFSGQNTVEVLRQVVHQDLLPPRQLLPSLPAELEAIILRCLARDPGERYASARAVATDLQRYLDGEVVEAFTAGLAYRLTRFVLRNKALAGMAAVAVVALLLASVAVVVFAVKADAARQRAEQRQGQAEELIRFMVVDLRDKLDSLGRLDVLSDVGTAATEYFAAVPEEELSEAELLRRSRTLYQIGDVRIKQGDLAGATAPMKESLALAQRLVDHSPEDGEHLFELGQAHFWVGFVHWEQGDLAAARAPFEAYLEISRRLAEKDPANLEWRRELSYAHSNLGSLLRAEGDLEEALGQFRATLTLDRELAAEDPANSSAESELAASHNLVGVVLQDLGRLGEAGEHLRSDLEIRQALMEADPTDPHLRDLLATSQSRLGAHLSMVANWPAAIALLEKAKAILKDLGTHDPTNARWRFKLAWVHLHLGRAAYSQGDLAVAEVDWQFERRLMDDLLAQGDTPHAWRRTQAVGLYHRALLELANSDAAGARADALGAVKVLDKLAAERSTDREVHRWLGQSYLLLGGLEETKAGSMALFKKAEATVAPFARGARDGRLLAPWATALRCLGRFDEARSAEEILRALGYSEPGLEDLCRRVAGSKREDSR